MTNGLNDSTKAYFRYTVEGPITTSDNVDVSIENVTDSNNNITPFVVDTTNKIVDSVGNEAVLSITNQQLTLNKNIRVINTVAPFIFNDASNVLVTSVGSGTNNIFFKNDPIDFVITLSENIDKTAIPLNRVNGNMSAPNAANKTATLAANSNASDDFYNDKSIEI